MRRHCQIARCAHPPWRNCHEGGHRWCFCLYGDTHEGECIAQKIADDKAADDKAVAEIASTDVTANEATPASDAVTVGANVLKVHGEIAASVKTVLNGLSADRPLNAHATVEVSSGGFGTVSDEDKAAAKIATNGNEATVQAAAEKVITVQGGGNPKLRFPAFLSCSNRIVRHATRVRMLKQLSRGMISLLLLPMK